MHVPIHIHKIMESSNMNIEKRTGMLYDTKFEKIEQNESKIT